VKTGIGSEYNPLYNNCMGYTGFKKIWIYMFTVSTKR